MTAPSFSRLSPLCCSATACASSAEFHSRFPLSAFLAVNAICQCYQRNSYCCLPLSALLAATNAICLGFQCYPSLSLPLSVVLAVSAIRQGYECHPSLCLPFSALLAVTAFDSSCHLPSAALGSPSRSSRRRLLLAFLATLPSAALQQLARLPPIFTLAYRFRLSLPSTPSVRAINAIPSAAYRFRLFSPLPTPSVWAINAIPPSAYRFRLYLPSAPFSRL
jgi:hypothetical protein